MTVIALDFEEQLELTAPSIGNPEIQTILQHTQVPQYTLNGIAQTLRRGDNPFIDSDLSIDGLGFAGGTKEPDSTIFRWIVKHAEALYQTGKGMPEGHYQGYSALSADKQTLFLFVEGKPTGPIAIKGLKNKIQRTRIVGTGAMVEPEIYNKLYWSSVPGIVYIPVPEDLQDQYMTVIAVLLDGEIELYRERVGAVESNL